MKNNQLYNSFESGSIPDIEKRTISGKMIIVILSILLFLTFILSFFIGRYPVGVEELLGILLSKVPFVNFERFWTAAEETAILNVRLPRIIISILVGACLSASGAAYQGVFQNPIASPDILGASAGAGFGAALAIFLDLNNFYITLFAFAASLTTVFLVFVIGNNVKGERTLGLVLAGIMVSSLFSAGTSFIKLVADPNNKLPAITYWLLGSLSGANNGELIFIIWPMLIGLIPLFLLRWKLNVITLGDSEAQALGVDAVKVRLAVVLGATLITAASVSVSGMIGWVGLVIPHMMRRLVGSDYRFLLPASFISGGLFMLIVDNISRNLTTTEIPIGILTAFIGAPLFLILIIRRDSWHA